MNRLSAYQVASIRILCSGLVLIPFANKALREVPRNKLFLVILSGLIGSFVPAYLFCIAETRIDSSLAAVPTHNSFNTQSLLHSTHLQDIRRSLMAN